MKQNQKYTVNSKVIVYRPARKTAYPNAASTRDILGRVLDLAVTAAASAGIVTALMCLFTFF